MRDLVVPVSIPTMTPEAIALVRRVEDGLLATEPQIDLKMHHLIHAGMYVRSVMVPAGMAITGALVKIATVLVVDGDVIVWIGSDATRITGRGILPAAAGRKQMFVALTDTHITMSFPTSARTVEEAEREFTDEADRLASRRSSAINETIITGDQP